MIRVGITCAVDAEPKAPRYYVNTDYIKAVQQVGGAPLLLPCDADGSRVDCLLETVEAVLLPGGVDVDPAFFGEEPAPALGHVDPERDEAEMSVAKRCLDRHIPVLGICRGVQLLNVAAGGSLYQDLGSQVAAELIQHIQGAPRWHGSHPVRVKTGSKLHALMGGRDEIRVNSFHHQGLNDVAEQFEVTATAPDGVIEAVESRTHPFAVGVQWHPEAMWERDRRVLGLFRGLVEAGVRRAAERRAA